MGITDILKRFTSGRTSHPGIRFTLPPEITEKKVSVIEVGPYAEDGLAEQARTALNIPHLEGLFGIRQYILVHDENLTGLEALSQEPPFLDRIARQSSYNSSLAEKLGMPYDAVLHDTLNPGTSDMDGSIVQDEAYLALGAKPGPEDKGFQANMHFVQGKLTPAELEAVSAYIANPELNQRHIFSRGKFERGVTLEAPLVALPPEVVVKKYDITRMSDKELLALNAELKLAATLEELQHFRSVYQDGKFLEARVAVGLDERATDAEVETWFGLRSEHCFHKELNARVTLDKIVGEPDPVFERAVRKGWLQDAGDHYVLEEGLFQKFIVEPARRVEEKLKARGKNWLISMFTDNAGAVNYNALYMFCVKMETHNSPSEKEPKEGAKTGLDGLFRDVMAMLRGSFEVIAGFFQYCTGDPRYAGWLPEGKKHPRAQLRGITQGVREAGNEMQIPTLAGGVVTDPRYAGGKGLVHAGGVGFSPITAPDGTTYLGKKPSVGDTTYVIGQAVGVDGVHGASESSLSAGKHISLGHVQADFSFIQSKVRDFILAAGRENLFTYVQDMGAMGLGSAAYETARETGGTELDTAKHPVKYKGIQPFQIICSETQDRMYGVAKPDAHERLQELAREHDVPLTAIGKLTDDGFVRVYHDGNIISLLNLETLFNKEPRKHLHGAWKPQPQTPLAIEGTYSSEDMLRMVMAQPDVASKEWFFRQKDFSVKGGTIQGPLLSRNMIVDADATLQKPLATEGEDFGALAYALALAPKVSDIDPFLASQRAYVDFIGKVLAIGGTLPNMNEAKWDAWAVCGNYCQPNSDARTTKSREAGEHNLASLVREGIGVCESIDELAVPIISGKDSMKCSSNNPIEAATVLKHHRGALGKIYRASPQPVRHLLERHVEQHDSYFTAFIAENVPPDMQEHMYLVTDKGKRWIEVHDPDTYLVSGAVKIDDYRLCVDATLKETGDHIYVLGTTHDHLGASQFAQALGYHEHGKPYAGGAAPATDFAEFKSVAVALESLFQNEVLASCAYVHNGGIGAALTRAAIAGEKGAVVDLDGLVTSEEMSKQSKLFSETPGRFIVTVRPEDQERFEALTANVPRSHLGLVTTNDLFIRDHSSTERARLNTIQHAYQATFDFGNQYGTHRKVAA